MVVWWWINVVSMVACFGFVAIEFRDCGWLLRPHIIAMAGVSLVPVANTMVLVALFLVIIMEKHK